MSHPHVPEQLLRRFVECDLTEAEAVDVALHLDDCPSCSTAAAAMEPLAAAFASVDDPLLPEGLIDDILEAAELPVPVRPEPAIAAGLLGLAALLVLVSSSPHVVVASAAAGIKALIVAGSALMVDMVEPGPVWVGAALLTLLCSTAAARSLELKRQA